MSKKTTIDNQNVVDKMELTKLDKLICRHEHDEKKTTNGKWRCINIDLEALMDIPKKKLFTREEGLSIIKKLKSTPLFDSLVVKSGAIVNGLPNGGIIIQPVKNTKCEIVKIIDVDEEKQMLVEMGKEFTCK